VRPKGKKKRKNERAPSPHRFNLEALPGEEKERAKNPFSKEKNLRLRKEGKTGLLLILSFLIPTYPTLFFLSVITISRENKRKKKEIFFVGIDTSSLFSSQGKAGGKAQKREKEKGDSGLYFYFILGRRARGDGKKTRRKKGRVSAYAEPRGHGRKKKEKNARKKKGGSDRTCDQTAEPTSGDEKRGERVPHSIADAPRQGNTRGLGEKKGKERWGGKKKKKRQRALTPHRRDNRTRHGREGNWQGKKKEAAPLRAHVENRRLDEKEKKGENQFQPISCLLPWGGGKREGPAAIFQKRQERGEKRANPSSPFTRLTKKGKGKVEEKKKKNILYEVPYLMGVKEIKPRKKKTSSEYPSFRREGGGRRVSEKKEKKEERGVRTF